MAEKRDDTLSEKPIIYYIKQFINWIEENIHSLSLLCIIGFIALGVLNNEKSNVYTTILYVLKLLGVAVSSVIIYKTYFNRNILKRFCQIGKTVDCNNILNSKISKFFDWISFGELSLIYFLATLIWGIFFSEKPISIYFILSVLASLFVIFSIIWQAFMAKKCCFLCMIINLIIIGEVTTAYIGQRIKGYHVFVLEVISFITCFILFFLGWIILRDLLLDRRRKQRLEEKNIELLSDVDVFNALLRKSPKVTSYTSFRPLSNKVGATNYLLIITNPSCNICAKLHKELESVSNDFNINLIIAVDQNKENKDAALKIISTYLSKGYNEASDILEGWFYDKQIDKDITVNEGSHEILEAHQKYCQLIKLTETPTVIINGHLYPRIYELDDLKLLL